ncbi:hypothetical protein EZV73_10270 [Acidaminobacter sp. JC074]|uniref:hypothetical protein n=1 Tax=Acidaminobacter sp. JC074 TaxID=2530199 RepID=UPI001F109F7C|nr:hypothetical protein [Acidaminobacter sp. JC074]MCH4887960.1 hypothetical protein [Acidaminobacter sp. JC074]
MKKFFVTLLVIIAIFILLIKVNMGDSFIGKDTIRKSLDFNDFEVSVYLGVVRLSPDTYKITPSDGDRIKSIFKDNQLISDFRFDQIPDDCIEFKMGYPKSGLDHYILLIDPVTRSNWCYSFTQTDYAYSVDLNEDDLEFLLSLQEKYSVPAKQNGVKKGKVLLTEKKQEEENHLYNFSLDYPHVIITEVFYEVSFKEDSTMGSIPIDLLDEIDVGFNVPDERIDNLTEIKIIVRGYQVVEDKEIPFQNIFYFRGPEL